MLEQAPKNDFVESEAKPKVEELTLDEQITLLKNKLNDLDKRKGEISDEIKKIEERKVILQEENKKNNDEYKKTEEKLESLEGSMVTWGKEGPVGLSYWEAEKWCKDQGEGWRLSTEKELMSAKIRKIEGFSEGLYHFYTTEKEEDKDNYYKNGNLVMSGFNMMGPKGLERDFIKKSNINAHCRCVKDQD